MIFTVNKIDKHFKHFKHFKHNKKYKYNHKKLLYDPFKKGIN